MTHRYTLTFILFLLLMAAGCAPGIEPPIPKSGSLDFSRFVIAGSSAAAGVSNARISFDGKGWLEGGSYEEGQFMSCTNILAQQARKTGNFHFSQPLASGNGNGYASLTGFKSPACEQTIASPVFNAEQADGSWNDNISHLGPFNNLAMPDMKLKDITSKEYLVCNAYSQRMMGSASTADSINYADWISQQAPTFFVLSMGMEDVLHYALFGGKDPEQPLTSPDEFEFLMDSLLRSLTIYKEAKGVILNVPDITLLPYFQTIKPFRPHPDSGCQPLPLFIRKRSGSGVVSAGEGDLILLSALRDIELRGHGLTANRPIDSKFVLDSYEVNQIRQTIKAYNEILRSFVDYYNQQDNRIVLVDLYELYMQADQGIQTNGILVGSDYLTGGFFSLDGIYPTGRGNALIANEVIKQMNDFWPEVSLPPVDITRFPGVAFP